jgi:hypothetical protein
VKKHGVVWIRISCCPDNIVYKNILLASSGGYLKMEIVCFFVNSTHTRLFGVGTEAHDFSVFGPKKGSRNEAGMGFVME